MCTTLASRVPFYRLLGVLAVYPQLHDLNRLTLPQTFSP